MSWMPPTLPLAVYRRHPPVLLSLLLSAEDDRLADL
jgi:hypothetical protein